MESKQLYEMYERLFDGGEPRFFFAPGRINLIGEHTDYNGGYVFPCAITKGTYALAEKRPDSKVRLYSMNFPEAGVIEFDLHDLVYDSGHSWANYPKGMLLYVKEAGYTVDQGFNVLYYGNIPNGAGLSSSASIELVTGVLLERLYGLSVDRIDLVKIGQQVENRFIGVNSGIMDQFAIGMGREQSAVLLDCNTLEYEYAPMDLGDHRILIMNTNKRRELSESKYNERRSECEQALQQLRKAEEIADLCSMTEEQFTRLEEYVVDECCRRRARHAVSENRRTIKAAEALKQGNLLELGRLMDASHDSLRDDYEVTGRELDTLVAAARGAAGVLGARMTGAGFGGCAIALIEKDRSAAIIQQVGEVYRREIGWDADFYEVSIGGGARELQQMDEVIE